MIALWLFLKGSKILQYVLIAAALSGTIFGVYKHVQHQAIKAYVVEQERLTAAESARREKVIREAQAKAEAAVALANVQEQTNVALRKQIAALSAANNGKHCLDAASVRRLSKAGQPASSGTYQRPTSGITRHIVRTAPKAT